jgi:hypothetical protein
VCPVENCVTLVPFIAGVDPRTGVAVGGHRTWMGIRTIRPRGAEVSQVRSPQCM